MNEELFDELGIDISSMYIDFKMECMLNDVMINFTAENLGHEIERCFIVDYKILKAESSKGTRAVCRIDGKGRSCKIKNIVLNHKQLADNVFNILEISQTDNLFIQILLALKLFKRLFDMMNILLTDNELLVYTILCKAESEDKNLGDRDIFNYINKAEICSLNEQEIFSIINGLEKKKIISIKNATYKVIEKQKIL